MEKIRTILSRQPAWTAILLVLSLCAAPAVAQDNHGAEGLLTVRTGTLPIILSAPHGGRHPIPNTSERRGIGVAQFRTSRDNYTDELVDRLSAALQRIRGATPFAIIARFDRKYLDVNRSPADAYESDAAKPYYEAYHRALEAACRQVREKWGRGLLLDIHGQGAQIETIYRGTYNGRTVKSLIERFGREALSGPQSIFGYLEQKGYRVSPAADTESSEGRYLGGYIVRTYGSHRGTNIDAIQMEFGTLLRNRRNLERMAADVAEAIVIFTKEYLPVATNGAGPEPAVQP